MSEKSSEIFGFSQLDTESVQEESYSTISESEQEEQRPSGGGDCIVPYAKQPDNVPDLALIQKRVVKIVKRINRLSQCLRDLHLELKARGDGYLEESKSSLETKQQKSTNNQK